MQAKLLRALQGRELERVGDTRKATTLASRIAALGPKAKTVS